MVGDDMKKIITFMLIISIVLLSFSSCFAYELRGIEEYRKENSSVGISDFLIPSYEFLSDFDYLEGDYYYVYSGNKYYQESELMYLIYNDETYNLAKNCVLNGVNINQKVSFACGDYVFYENLHKRSSFPYHFNMVSINDESNTIVFMGFYINKPAVDNSEEKNYLASEDFEAFLKRYYSFYNFD